MLLNLVNRKTGKAEQVDFKKLPLIKLKQIGAAAVCSANYFVCVVAESMEDIDFISAHFANIPLPDISAKQAVWTGDLAAFIIMNFPPEDNSRELEEVSEKHKSNNCLQKARREAGFQA